MEWDSDRWFDDIMSYSERFMTGREHKLNAKNLHVLEVQHENFKWNTSI